MSRIIKLAVIIFFIPLLAGATLAYSLVNFLEIPDVKQIGTYGPKSATRLYADNGALFAELVKSASPYLSRRCPTT